MVGSSSRSGHTSDKCGRWLVQGRVTPVTSAVDGRVTPVTSVVDGWLKFLGRVTPVTSVVDSWFKL